MGLSFEGPRLCKFGFAALVDLEVALVFGGRALVMVIIDLDSRVGGLRTSV